MAGGCRGQRAVPEQDRRVWSGLAGLLWRLLQSLQGPGRGGPACGKQAGLCLILAAALAYCEMTGKSFPPSRPQRPRLQKGQLGKMISRVPPALMTEIPHGSGKIKTFKTDAFPSHTKVFF